MKKIFFLAATLVLACSCDLDINENPNYPGDSSVDANLILPAVQNSIANATGDGLFNYGSVFAQYFDQNPVANQYTDLTQYNITQDGNQSDRIYRTLYAGALADIQKIQQKRSNNTADLYVVQVLRTYALQLLVDATGETPYSEALNENNSKPKYDGGDTVYVGALSELDAAEEALNSEDQFDLTDMMFDGDMDQWRGFANALRLRMYLRLIDGGVNADSYTQRVRALVSANEFFTGDVEFGPFSDEANKRNPWYTDNYVELAENFVASYPIISYMNSTADPRIAYTFVRATEGDNNGYYVGELPGSRVVNQQLYDKIGYFSRLNYYATAPVKFFTQAELQFLIAEVQLRFNNDAAAAQAAYEKAIAADFEARGISGYDQFIAGSNVAWSSAQSTADQLHLIYMQKWVALLYMDHFEAWSEQRRTDVPAWSSHTAAEIQEDATVYTPGELIVPMRNFLGGTAVPLRMFYSTQSVNLNDNAPEPKALTVPVFWDRTH